MNEDDLGRLADPGSIPGTSTIVRQPKLTAALIEAAFLYFGSARYEKVVVFACDVSFEELCELEDAQRLAFEMVMDDPAVVVRTERRGALDRLVSPRMLDDAAVHARCARAGELLYGSSFSAREPLAMLVDRLGEPHPDRIFPLVHDGRAWRPAPDGLVRFMKEHLVR